MSKPKFKLYLEQLHRDKQCQEISQLYEKALEHAVFALPEVDGNFLSWKEAFNFFLKKAYDDLMNEKAIKKEERGGDSK